MELESLKSELQNIDKAAFGREFAIAAVESGNPLVAADNLAHLETEYPALVFMGIIAGAMAVRGEITDKEALLLSEGILTTCVALVSPATSDKLKRELKQIDKKQLGMALASTLYKQGDMSEAHALLDALDNEYQALSFAGLIMETHTRMIGAEEYQADVLVSGTLAAGLALKQLIDQRELEDIPVRENE